MKNIMRCLVYITVIFLSSCTKSIDPGDWDILPPPTDDGGPIVNPPDEGKTVTLKVMSYNCRTSDVAAFTTLKSYVKEYNPDILLLRQVDSSSTRSAKVNRPKEVADELGMVSHFAKALDYQTGGYGNAVLSKFPILSTKTIKMSGAEARSCAAITVKIDDFNNLVIAGTELDPYNANESVRVGQISAILDYVENVTDPVILMGNFNLNASNQGYNNIVNTQVYDYIVQQFTFGCITNGCVLNSPVAAPTGIFDFVTFKPAARFTVSNYATGSKTTSGFLPVIAELKFKLLEK